MAKRNRQPPLKLVDQRGFNGNGATVNLVLVEAAVGRVAEVVNAAAKCAGWRKDVYGKRVRAAGQCYVVYRLNGHGWSTVQSAAGKPVGFELAQAVSRALPGRAMWLTVSDPASFIGYYLFDNGVTTEILEDFGDHHGDASHLPPAVVGKLDVRPTGRGIFASSLRKVAVSSLATPAKANQFIDDLLRRENTLAPVSGEWGGQGGTVSLDLPYVDADDVERMDFLGNAGG